MRNDVQQRLVRIRNELRAQKVAMELAYSSILWPQNAATASITESLNLELTDGVVARFRIRFQRTDGINTTPCVDFAQSVSFSPTYTEFTQSQGATVSGNDVGYVDDQNYTGYVSGAGADYVDYYIDFLRDLISNYYALSTVTVTINAEAIAMVSGQLIITRVI